MAQPYRFDQVAFSGGGIRCFWHGGFLSRVGNFDTLLPQRVTGVSGGALSAAAWIGRREESLLDLMCEAFRINDSNIASGQSNFTPHQELYRAVVETTLDQEAIDRVANGPELQILLASPPALLPAKLATLIYGLAYKIEEKGRGSPHLSLPGKLGLKPLRIDGREAARSGQLVDLICAAATIPPVFDVPRWEGERVLDGGMFDKAPLFDPDIGKTLVLLTKRYGNLPTSSRRIYAQPSAEVAADKIDFTDAGKVERTWQQGQLDGEEWLRKCRLDAAGVPR